MSYHKGHISLTLVFNFSLRWQVIKFVDSLPQRGTTFPFLILPCVLRFLPNSLLRLPLASIHLQSETHFALTNSCQSKSLAVVKINILPMESEEPNGPFLKTHDLSWLPNLECHGCLLQSLFLHLECTSNDTCCSLRPSKCVSEEMNFWNSDLKIEQ